VFVGKWNMEGQQYDGIVGPAAKVSAVRTYEWLSGGFFLIHRYEGRVGDAKAACIEVIGYDSTSQRYFLHSFYNDGKSNEWQATVKDNIWLQTGDWEFDGKAMKVRCTIEFSEDGNTMTGRWENSIDGSSWQTFWDVKATKVLEEGTKHAGATS
jgi:Protein of unknown function (DUF1579)